jgi:biotin carboxyl carrier protein
MIYSVAIAGEERHLELSRKDGIWQCRLDGHEVQVDVVQPRQNLLSILIDGKSYEIKREFAGKEEYVWVGTERYAVEVSDPRSLRGRGRKPGDDKGPHKLVALMPGKVVRLLVKEKSEVEAGQGILVVEAMKMQNEIKSSKKGIISKILTAEGDRVNAGDLLAIVD